MVVSKSLSLVLTRHLSSAPTLPSFTKIRTPYRARAIKAAQEAVIDYLHSTRLIPYSLAELISQRAIVSLDNLVSGIRFSTSYYSDSVKRVLRYKPINEFEFFYESIGIEHSEVFRFLPNDKFFFHEDDRILKAACVLSAFGFPWNKLGRLYKEERCVFEKGVEELESRLSGFKEDYGFSNASVVGICLAFPSVLRGELEVETCALFEDLKTVFVDFALGSCVEGNVDAWFEVCRKIKVFYDFGFEKGKVGRILGERKSIFSDFPLDVFLRKVEFFYQFGVTKKEVGFLLLERSEILNLDLELPVFSVVGLLKYFGLNAEELESVTRMYPHALGRNRMANLPHVMRSMDLHVWFFTKLRYGDLHLLASYSMSAPDEDVDKEFRNGLEKILTSKSTVRTMSKLDFIHGIGFGENAFTIKVLDHLYASSSELQKRFDCLLSAGIEFSNLCVMISGLPNILNQNTESLEQKLNFLFRDMGFSLRDLYKFPAFLIHSLEMRIKPRLEFHAWLMEKGLCTRKYCISSIVSPAEKAFVARMHRIHPAAPKYWLELFYHKSST